MKTAVLLMAHGSPDRPEDMEPFLRRVMTRRPPSPEFVREMQARYATFGGRSPLLDITCRQARALEARLNVPAAVGMLHWTPFIAEAVAALEADGIERIVGLPMAPQECALSVRHYEHALRGAVRNAEAVTIRHWYTEPRFLEGWAERIRTAGTGPLLFTAHSVPVEAAEPYRRHVRETIDGILARLGPVEWDFAWQSRSPGPGTWLEPDVDTKLREKGWTSVLVVPIGFVSDHAEVLYDIDRLHRAGAERLGMAYRRTEMLNDSPALIEALEAAVRRVL